MPTIAFRSPVTVPLLRKNAPKPAPPDPRAYETFRITQRFAEEDYLWRVRNPTAPADSGPKHNAVDIGNYRCADLIVAMAAGRATLKTDGAGALGVILDHGYGVTTEYWHLNRQDAKAGQQVAAGQRIGIVGSTGLGGVCHTHIVLRVNGTLRDPEPAMFGGTLSLSAGGSDVPDLAVYALQRITIVSGANIRDAPSLSASGWATGAESGAVSIGYVLGDSFAWTSASGEERRSRRWYVYWLDGKGWQYTHIVNVKDRRPYESGETVEVVKEIPTGITEDDIHKAVEYAKDQERTRIANAERERIRAI